MTVNPQRNGAIDPQRIGFANLDKHTTVNLEGLSLPDGQGSNANGNEVPKTVPRYPHIKDLQAKANATVRELSAFIPVC